MAILSDSRTAFGIYILGTCLLAGCKAGNLGIIPLIRNVKVEIVLHAKINTQNLQVQSVSKMEIFPRDISL